MSVVKLRKKDKEILDSLEKAIIAVKGSTTRAETVGMGLRFAYSNLNEFLATKLEGVENETVLELIRKPVRGEKTDARNVKEYLYS